MQYRTLGKTGFNISEISLGTWQVGGKWGAPFNATLADRILRMAIDQGVNFIDTADVYSDGLSEQAVGRAVKACGQKIYVATKCGRKITPHTTEGYTLHVLRKFVEDSLTRLDIECIDLIQLHCPPNDVYYRPEVFDLFDRLREEGKIQHLGVSVEKVEQAIKAIEYSNVCSVQIIFNLFRQRPAGLFFELAQQKNIGIIARVPLASGLLTGAFTRDTSFEKDDHRTFNREGAAFDKGETFSGIPYEVGLEAVEKLKNYFGDQPLAAIALQWILAHKQVSCVIPGASNEEQVLRNIQAGKEPNLREEDMRIIEEVYGQYIRPYAHQQW